MLHPVAAGRLGPVQGPVGPKERLPPRLRRPAERGTDRDRVAGGPGRLQDPAGDPVDLGWSGDVDHDRELVAPDAVDVVVTAQSPTHRRDERDQRLVARLVAAHVVDLLKVVNVNGDDHGPVRLAHLQPLLERAVVAQARERVAVGELGQYGELAQPFTAGGGMRQHERHDALVVRSEAVSLSGRDDQQHPGVTGGELSNQAILIVGFANIVADGLSMGVGNYLGIRSEEGARAAEDLPEAEAEPARHGLATFVAFVIAGMIPLAAYMVPDFGLDRFLTASGLTLATLFVIGALRSAVTREGWLASGLEMLGLGVVVAAAAYAAGALIAWVVS